MRTTAVVACVFAKIQELFDIEVPGFEIGTDGALALAALIHRHSGITYHLKERHHALRLAVGALDAATERTHIGPIISQTARKLGQQRIFLQRLVDAIQIVRHRGQIARRQLRTTRAGVKQGGSRTHKIKTRQQSIELDGACLALHFVQCQPHRHAHEKGLWQFYAPVLDVQEITVIQGLQAKIIELQVALGFQRSSEARQVKTSQLLVQQLRLDTAPDEIGEIFGVALTHFRLDHFCAENFTADVVEQQSRRNKAVCRILFDQRARREYGALAHFSNGYAIIQILQSETDDFVRLDRIAQAGAGGSNLFGQGIHVQGLGHASIDHIQNRRDNRPALRALTVALLPIQHVGTRHIVLTRAHQRQLDLILNVLDVESSAVRLTTQQCRHHLCGQLFHHFAHARRGRTLTAIDCNESLGQRNRYLGRLKCNHSAVAANDFVLIEGQNI